MQFRLLLVFSAALLLVVTDASAGPKEDVAAATTKWGETLGQNDPDKVVALYAPDAVLWERFPQQCGPSERRCATIS
jgi:hypothetical protein